MRIALEQFTMANNYQIRTYTIWVSDGYLEISLVEDMLNYVRLSDNPVKTCRKSIDLNEIEFLIGLGKRKIKSVIKTLDNMKIKEESNYYKLYVEFKDILTSLIAKK